MIYHITPKNEKKSGLNEGDFFQIEFKLSEIKLFGNQLYYIGVVHFDKKGNVEGNKAILRSFPALLPLVEESVDPRRMFKETGYHSNTEDPEFKLFDFEKVEV
jgi:hypothetical protein